MPSDSLTSQGRGGFLHNLDLRFKKKTFHRIGFENADNEDCNVDLTGRGRSTWEPEKMKRQRVESCQISVDPHL